ncbi:MAG: LamG-like jellyroll fold domain-containing protein [Bacteroidales bacterium]
MGKSEAATSFDWKSPLNDVVVLGCVSTGSDFVTAGPNKLLTVLRDPPGSNSYAFLEKGTSFKRTSAYTGNAKISGTESMTQNLGTELVTFTGVGVGTINSVTTSTGFTVGLKHETMVGGSNGKESVTTMTTRFQTSDDALLVGADGDVYIGYSTNIVFGVANSINFVANDKIEAVGSSAYEKIYDLITPMEDNDWVLVQQKTLAVGEHFSTLFAYPQVHIENVLIPNLQMMRNGMMRFESEKSAAEFQAEANQTKKSIVVSYLDADHPDFGRSNDDEVFKGMADPNSKDLFDGPSYRIYFPDDQELYTDTILYMNQSIDAWENQMAENEKAKKEAVLLQNYSFHAGSPIEYTESYSHNTVKSQTFSYLIGGVFKDDAEAEFFGSGFTFEAEEEVTTEHGGDFSTESERSQSKGFVLAEEGDGDYLSVDVCYEKGKKKEKQEGVGDPDEQYYSSFIFRTKGGATACPYEGEYVTKYFEPGQHVLSAATMQIEVPKIAIEKDFIENVPSGKPAYLTIYLRNNSEVQQEGWYDLKVDDASNPNGARFSMDGGAIGNGRAVMLPAGETLIKTIEVSKGSVMNYDDLKLILISQCQGDPTTFIPVISDTVSFSVHFTPSCTDVNIVKPANNWTYNTKLPTVTQEGVKKHYMEVVMDGFDVNYDNFNRIMLQYKPASASDEEWVTVMNYYNDEVLYEEAVGNGKNAEMIQASDAGKIRHKWMIDELQDQRYDLRAVSICVINNEEIENSSEIRSGIKDMYTPRLFGSAQPANGILTINDEVRLNFNEVIAEGYLTKNNFEVTGVRNGSKTDHSVSILLDGENDELRSDLTRNWTGKDITVEMWVWADKAQNATFFSQGNVNESFEIGVTAENRMVVRMGSKEIVSRDAVPFEKGSWAHVAAMVDKEGNVSAYYNYVAYIDQVATGNALSAGNWVFGRSLMKSDENFAGKMHNARIWNKVLTAGRLQINSLSLLSGTESGLLAYYSMNEAKGNVLEDKAQGMNLDVKGAEWALPEGRSAKFDGQTQYLIVNTGSSAVIDHSMDYTIEFWFKGDSDQDNATLAASGRGDGDELGGSANLFCIGFENRILTFRNNGVQATADGDFLDNNWHHLAISVNRNTGRSQIVVDGILRSYFESADLGSVSSDCIYLGARKWIAADDQTLIHVDNFFKGGLDEFRIWNHYKGEGMVDKCSRERLHGSEKGLLAYYPFEDYIEWQGTKELQFSLKDQKVQRDPALVIPDAVAKGGDLESKEAAPVKDRGPIENLQYNFVVNNDALIINLTEPWEKVEKTIVTFTVDGVRDINGNEIVSPVTWSAYIDRNQIKWAEDEVNVEKAVYEAYAFSVDLRNNGGSVQNYVIENMPSWLEVLPVSGSINPASSQKITFKVDESLNIGSYNEVIYMRNDNNVLEALPVNVKVNGEKPDWSVNPKDFKYNMNVYGKIRINNIFSNDVEDMLAAFIDGKCVGMANSQYHQAGDMWYAYLTVYNNNPVAPNIEFRIWDASTGKIYIADPAEIFGFRNNDVAGTAAMPIVFDTREIVYQNIALESGWNWISFQVVNDILTDVNAILSNNRWKTGDVVKSETAGFDTYSKRSGWVGTLSDNGGFNNTSMFMMNTSESKVLSVSGSPVDMNQTPLRILGKTADGIKRWSYISYQPTVNQPLKEALAGYEAAAGDVIKSQDAFAMYAENLGWIGNLTYMEPGRGYMMQRNADSDALLTYSERRTLNVMRLRTTQPINRTYVNHAYSGNMNVVATIHSGVELEDNDKLQAYVDGELRGESVVTVNPETKQPLFFMNISGDQQGTLTFKVVRNDNPIGEAVNAMTFSKHTVAGTIQEPIALSFAEDKIAGVYPNPFTEELNITTTVAVGDKVEIVISDIVGNLMHRYSDTSVTEGAVNLIWKEGRYCLPGIYIVKIAVNDTVRVFKVEKK